MRSPHPDHPQEYSSATAMTPPSIWTMCWSLPIACVPMASIATSISTKNHRPKDGRAR
jgi:hypothetical protein